MSNIKMLVTQAIDEQGDAKRYTTPFRTVIERVRQGDVVAYIGKGRNGPEVEHLLEVEVVTRHYNGAITLDFADGHYRSAFPGLPLMVARRK